MGSGPHPRLHVQPHKTWVLDPIGAGVGHGKAGNQQKLFQEADK
jgi:hypothetical protein